VSRDDREEETSVSDASGGGHGDANARTVVIPLDADAPPGRPPLAPHQAFERAFKDLRAAAQEAPAEAVLAVGVDPKGKLVAQTTLESGRVLTIGRHTQCSFRLPATDVSLRHLVAHISDGGTRLWDLKSGQPFKTEDGVACSAVIGEGPLFVSIGCYAVLFVPKMAVAGGDWPSDARSAWNALAPRQFVDRRDAPPPGAEPRQAPAWSREASVSARSISRITRVGAPALLGTEAVLRGPVWAELAIEDDDGVAKHKLSAEQIDRGVLLGRSSRCQVGLDTDDTLSRVHVLVVRVGDDVWAIDTASTNGTSRNGANIEAVVLRDRDALQLASVATMHWKRLVHAAA
jgi:FHA domain-containing protein